MSDDSGKVGEKTRKYEYVAPDGGYGYLICLAFVINCSTVTMFMGSFGLLFNDFMLEIGMNSTNVTFLTGLNAMCFAISGFLTNSLLKVISHRNLCLLAVVLHDLGALGMVFAKSIPVFFLCQGMLVGSGVGMTFNLSCGIINDYFVKRRILAFSLVQFFVAVAAMVAPLFVKWSLQEYGYRGTLLLVAGIMMQNIFGAALMQPVSMHLKRVEILPTEEMQPLLVGDKKNNIPTVKLSDDEKGTTKKPEENINKIALENGKKSIIRRVLDMFVDISFAKKYLLSCICTGPAMAAFADSTFSIILPQALYALDWSQDKVALAISTYGFGDLAMRTTLVFTGSWIMKIGVQESYVLGVVLGGISRLCMLWSENEIAIFLYISMMGVSRCCIMVLMTMVVSDAVPAKHFTEALGLSMLCSGLMMIILGPAIGAIRDLTNSYNSAFYLLTTCYIIVALFWSIELCYKKNKEKRKIQRENLEKIKSSRLNKGK